MIRAGPQLDQRTSGNAGAANAVIGHAHSAAAASNVPLIPPIKPFQVFIRPTPVVSGSAPDGTFQAMVYLNSNLLRTITPNDTQAFTGLGVWIDDFIPGDDYSYGEIAIDPTTGRPTAATILTGETGDWTPDDGDLPGSGNGPFEYDLSVDDSGNNIYTVTTVRFLIFTSNPDGSGGIENLQKVITDLIMMGDVYEGETQDSDGDDVVIGYTRPIAHNGAAPSS